MMPDGSINGHILCIYFNIIEVMTHDSTNAKTEIKNFN